MRLWAGLAIGVVYFAVFLYGVGETILGDPGETAAPKEQAQKQRPKEETTAAPKGQAKTTQEKATETTQERPKQDQEQPKAADPLPKASKEDAQEKGKAKGGGESATLSDRERKRAQSVVNDFVYKVWGYKGQQEDLYRSRVEELTADEFRSSPAWPEVESGAEIARTKGTPEEPASYLVATEFYDFKTSEESPDAVSGVAYFQMEEEPSDAKSDYSQEFRLERQGGEWKIVYGGESQLTS